MRPFPLRCLLLPLLLGLQANLLAAAIQLAVVADKNAPGQEAFVDAIADALEASTGREVVRTPRDGVPMARLIKEGQDLILVTGLAAQAEALALKSAAVPVVVASAHEAALEDVTVAGTVSVVGLRGFAARDLARFAKASPFKNLKLVVDGGLWRARTKACEAWRARLAEGVGSTVELVPLEADPEDALHRIGFLAEAAYLTPSDACTSLGWTLFVKRLTARRIPTCSLAGAPDLELGVRFGAREDVRLRLAQAVAAALKARLDGGPAAVSWVEPMGDWNELPPAEGPPSVPAQVVIPAIPAPAPPAAAPSPAADTVVTLPIPAEAPAAPPPFVAPPVEPAETAPPSPPRPLDLADILDLALRQNPRYLAEKAGTRAVKEAGQEALGPLLPQVEGGYQYRQVDEDRAASSNGDLAESRTALGVRISQTLYNDKLFSDVATARKETARRLHDLDGQALDLLTEASLRFYDYVARGRLLELAQRHLAELEKTRDAAQSRAGRGEGASGEAERWETEILRARRNVLEAQSARDQARVILGIRMGEGASASAPIVEPSPEDGFPVLEGQLDSMLGRPDSWEVLRRYSVSVGLVNAPELKSAARRLEIAGLEKDQSTRSFFLPEVKAVFASEQELDADPPASADGRDREDWEVRISATLPLFDGGRNVNRYQREAAELDQQKRLLDAARSGIEERCHTSVLALQSAWPGLRLQEQAARQARAVADRLLAEYAAGRAGPLNALDALDSVRREEGAAVQAWLHLQQHAVQWQRSMAWFELTRSREDRHAFIAGLALRLGAAPAP